MGCEECYAGLTPLDCTRESEDYVIRTIRSDPYLTPIQKKEAILCWYAHIHDTGEDDFTQKSKASIAAADWLRRNGYRSWEEVFGEG
jgi:hypothetical protein